MEGAPTVAENRLIAALSEDVRRRLIPHLELVDLPLGKVLYESNDGVLRLLPHRFHRVPALVMSDGDSAEIAMVGNEGVLGVAVFLGGGSTTSRAVVQSAGSAYRLPRQRLIDEFDRHGELESLLLRYTQCLITRWRRRPCATAITPLTSSCAAGCSCRWTVCPVTR
jgi:hypothetical protein